MPTKKSSKKGLKNAPETPKPKVKSAKKPKQKARKRSREVPKLTKTQLKIQLGLRSCSLPGVKNYLRWLKTCNLFDKSETEIDSLDMNLATAYAAAHAHDHALSADSIRAGVWQPSSKPVESAVNSASSADETDESDESASESDSDRTLVRGLAAQVEVLTDLFTAFVEKEKKDAPPVVKVTPPVSTFPVVAGGSLAPGTLTPPSSLVSSKFEQEVAAKVHDTDALAIWHSWHRSLKLAYSLGLLVPVAAFAAKRASDAVLSAFKSSNAFAIAKDAQGALVSVPTTSVNLKAMTSQAEFLKCLKAKDTLDLYLKPAKAVANLQDRGCIEDLLTYVPFADVVDWYAQQNVARHRIDPASGQPIPFARLGPPSAVQTAKWGAEALARKAAPAPAPSRPRSSAPQHAAGSSPAPPRSHQLAQKEFDKTKLLNFCLRFQKGPCPLSGPHDEKRYDRASRSKVVVSVYHKCGRCEAAGHGVSACSHPPL